MAQKYFNVKETAGKLGISEAEVKQMMDRRELYGYRDGADWKFKTEDIERIAKERAQSAAQPDDDTGDVLLSEHELGQADPGLSGTVIGPRGKAPAAAESDIKLADSDVKLADSDVRLAESDVKLADSDVRIAESDIRIAESDIRLADSDVPLAAGPKKAAGKKGDVDAKVSEFEELDLTLDQDLSLDDSDAGGKAAKKPATGDSAVDLSGKGMDDDDLVLGGSGTGSDITIGGDSGISLVDPADSGLSLEEPLNLGTGTEESLELGEDDLLAFSADTESPTALKSEDDFQLTPLAEAEDGEDSESGSQVIALDTESDVAAPRARAGGVAAMLEEDLGAEPALGLAPAPLAGSPSGIGLDAQADALALGTPMLQPAALLPEAPYSIWNVLSLILCSLVLVLCGMMMYDLLRNIWSWDKATVEIQPINSGLMDWLLSLVEGK